MKTGWISNLTFLNNRKKCQPILGTHKVSGVMFIIPGLNKYF